MIITISGKPGSGKSTIAKMLAEKYDLKHYSTGDFFRAKAKEKGISLKEFSILAEKSKKFDNETDAWQSDLGKTEDNFIIDGRLSHRFIEKALKIFLDVDKKIGALRIMNENRNEEKAINEDHAIHLWEFRVNSEQKRYKDYYQIDLYDLSQYNYVLDTSNLLPREVLNNILEFIEIQINKI